MIKSGIITMVLLSSLHANWFTNFFDSTPTPTISFPIDLSKASSFVESDVRVEEDGAYYFTLEFLYTGEIKDGVRDYAIARKISGFNCYSVATGKKYKTSSYEVMYRDLKKDGLIINHTYDADGTVIPIKITVYDKSRKKLILNEKYNSKGFFSESKYYIDRDIVMIKMKKGKYSIKIENLKGIKEMQARNANIRFGRHGNGK